MLSKLEELRNLRARIYEEVHLDHDTWIFSYHDHYNEPRYSVWLTGLDPKESMMLVIKNGKIFANEMGQYTHSQVNEAISILTDHLKGKTK